MNYISFVRRYNEQNNLWNYNGKQCISPLFNVILKNTTVVVRISNKSNVPNLDHNLLLCFKRKQHETCVSFSKAEVLLNSLRPRFLFYLHNWSICIASFQQNKRSLLTMKSTLLHFLSLLLMLSWIQNPRVECSSLLETGNYSSETSYTANKDTKVTVYSSPSLLLKYSPQNYLKCSMR